MEPNQDQDLNALLGSDPYLSANPGPKNMNINKIITYFQVFSAGRDKNLYLTDLRQNDRYTLVCRETAPILKMNLTPDQVKLFVDICPNL